MFFASRSKFSRCETKLRIWFSEIIRSRSLIKHHFVFPWRKISGRLCFEGYDEGIDLLVLCPNTRFCVLLLPRFLRTRTKVRLLIQKWKQTIHIALGKKNPTCKQKTLNFACSYNLVLVWFKCLFFVFPQGGAPEGRFCLFSHQNFGNFRCISLKHFQNKPEMISQCDCYWAGVFLSINELRPYDFQNYFEMPFLNGHFF